VQGPGGAALRSGRRALEQGDWESARSAFTAALAAARTAGEAAAGRDGLAQALWSLGRAPEAIALREQAFSDLVRAGRCTDAARCAVWVAHQHVLADRRAAARGWLARAEQVMADVPPCPGHGAADGPGSVALEAGTALTSYRGLGAVPAAGTSAPVLRAGGEPAGRRPRATASLSAREEEVLALVARGLSNAGIARALVISEKTAGHHVSHILAKLGVPNRAAAAACAVRRRRDG
jgi:DNA-binding CsgD family transcriptional regulator